MIKVQLNFTVFSKRRPVRLHNEFVLAVFLHAEGASTFVAPGLLMIHGQLLCESILVPCSFLNPQLQRARQSPRHLRGLSPWRPPFSPAWHHHQLPPFPTMRSVARHDDRQLYTTVTCEYFQVPAPIVSGMRDASTQVVMRGRSITEAESLHMLPGVGQLRGMVYIAQQEAELASLRSSARLDIY